MNIFRDRNLQMADTKSPEYVAWARALLGSCSPTPRHALPRLSSLKSGLSPASGRGVEAEARLKPRPLPFLLAGFALEGRARSRKGRILFLGRCCRGRRARGGPGAPLPERAAGTRGGAGLAGGWRPGRRGRGRGGLALAPSSSACGWRRQSSSVRALPTARVPFGLSSRLWSHGVRRDQPGGILLAQRRLRPPQGAAWRQPGDGGARRAMGRRRQGEGGGSAGARRRHRVPLPGESAGLRREASPGAGAQNSNLRSKLRCHLAGLSSCYDLQRSGEMAGGQRPLTRGLGLRVRGGSGRECRLMRCLWDARCLESCSFRSGDQCSNPGLGQGGGGIRFWVWGCTARGLPPTRSRRPCAAAEPSPSSPTRPGGPSGPNCPEIQTHRSCTCRPRAWRALPPPVHFVDARTHLRG